MQSDINTVNILEALSPTTKESDRDNERPETWTSSSSNNDDDDDVVWPKTMSKMWTEGKWKKLTNKKCDNFSILFNDGFSSFSAAAEDDAYVRLRTT